MRELSHKPMMIFYDSPISGHAHRVRALLQLLQLPYQTHELDLLKREHKRADFLAINPLGQIPVLQDGDLILRDSTAILTYLALSYDPKRQWLPESAPLQGQIQAWLATSVKEVYAGPCVARLAQTFAFPINQEKAVAKAHELLSQLFEPQLRQQDWLVGDTATIADIANYSYWAVAEEGGIDLTPYPSVRAWIARMEALPGFLVMPKTAK